MGKVCWRVCRYVLKFWHNYPFFFGTQTFAVHGAYFEKCIKADINVGIDISQGLCVSLCVFVCMSLNLIPNE